MHVLWCCPHKVLLPQIQVEMSQVISSDGSTDTCHITFERILEFATGASKEPPIGFQPQPSISFQQSSRFPRANTCINTLYLPLEDMSLSTFHLPHGLWNSKLCRLWRTLEFMIQYCNCIIVVSLFSSNCNTRYLI